MAGNAETMQKSEAKLGVEDAKAFAPKDKVDFEARENFKGRIRNMVDANVANIMKGKAPTDQYVSYIDAKMMSAQIGNFFLTKIGVTPPQVGVALTLSEAVLAPSVAERMQLIKAAAGMSGGVAGIALIVNGIFAALGVGAGLIASTEAYFFGVAAGGPLAWIAGGVTLTIIAGYFTLKKPNENANTERYIKTLLSGLESAINVIWPEHGKELYK